MLLLRLYKWVQMGVGQREVRRDNVHVSRQAVLHMLPRFPIPCFYTLSKCNSMIFKKIKNKVGKNLPTF